MSTRESAPEGAPCWIELNASDVPRAKEFYGRIFGWTFEEAGEDYGGYITCHKDGRIVAGMMKNEPGSGYPDVWTTYLKVSDAVATQTRAEADAGTTLVEAMVVGNLGSMAVFADPGCATVGAWQPAEHTGYLVQNQHGAPAWHELQTREYAASVEFYQHVFGWQVQVQGDSPEFRYTVQAVDDQPHAGIFDASGFLPEEAPGSWLIYFGSDDVDLTLAQVVEMGGTVVDQPEDSPFGRIATFTDPSGARAKLVSMTDDAQPA